MSSFGAKELLEGFDRLGLSQADAPAVVSPRPGDVPKQRPILKQSRGVSIAVCDGGMNHHLGACGHLGSVIHRNYRVFKVAPSADTSSTRSYNLVGPLCTTIDTLGRAVELQELAVGDIVAVKSSGA